MDASRDLRDLTNIRKRLLIHGDGFNLGSCGSRSASARGERHAIVAALMVLIRSIWQPVRPHRRLV